SSWSVVRKVVRARSKFAATARWLTCFGKLTMSDTPRFPDAMQSRGGKTHELRPCWMAPLLEVTTLTTVFSNFEELETRSATSSRSKTLTTRRLSSIGPRALSPLDEID